MHALTHSWNLSPVQAIALQRELASAVALGDDFGTVRYVAGTDVGLSHGRLRAAVAVLSLADLTLVDSASITSEAAFPYVPGLLSFREIPPLMLAMKQLRAIPDLILCDGQGIAHPRQFGIACHLGLLTGIPTVGVAKSRLCGTHAEVPRGRGEWTALMLGDTRVGAVLRSRTGVRPLYVSPGHRITLESAIRFTMRCVTRFRLPETTRQAHRLASLVPDI